MNSKPKDHRPKIISFRTTLDGLNIAARQNILWPCHAFNISIPHKKKSGLDVFEETVLRITEIESGDTYRIADIACLFDRDKEGKRIIDRDGKTQTALVAFIQNRLYQLGFLNQRYELSEHGRELLNEWQNKSDETLEYTVATVFVDLLSGKLLPYISTEQLSHKKISWIGDNGFVEFLTNPTNEKSKVSARQIRLAKDSYWETVPNSNDIIRAIREYQKRYKRYALLNQDGDQYPPPVPMAEAISLHDKPVLVYLHCNVLIQEGNSDLLVTDGCGFGFSESFASRLNNQDLPWVTKLKQQGIVEHVRSSGMPINATSNKPYKHPQISKRIKNSLNSLNKLKELQPSSSNYEREYNREIESGIKNLYAGLEWSLRQVVANCPVSEWEHIFASQNYQDNEKLLYGFARKIGFSISNKNQQLLQVKAGAIRQINKGSVELQPLLAMAIAGASSNSTHPLHRLARNHSGFISHALRLKRYRDPIEHGNTAELSAGKDTLEELIETTVPMITSLVPHVANDLEVSGTTTFENDVNQDRLKAEISLEKVLGTAFLSQIRREINEQLVRSEMMIAEYNDDKAIEIIKCYASIIQHVLFDAVKDRRFEGEYDAIREKAIDHMLQSGFYSSAEAIPKQLKTINLKRLNRAVQGSSTTLGAHLLAVCLLGSRNELIQLRNEVPEFVEFIATLIQLRGHGNKQQSDFSRDDITSLKNNVFKAIKIITEVF